VTRYCLWTSCLVLLFVTPTPSYGHCDAVDGPVVTAARSALDKGDVTPVLKWVQPRHDDEVRASFRRTITVRAKGPEARELADRAFFETLVRLHRDGEGEPYTGLRPAGGPVSPAISAADRALEHGRVDALADDLAASVRAGVRASFARAAAAREHADESVARGREYVAAYVAFIHQVEALDRAAQSEAHGTHAENRPHEREHP
jgi:hypothetical protein